MQIHKGKKKERKKTIKDSRISKREKSSRSQEPKWENEGKKEKKNAGLERGNNYGNPINLENTKLL